MGHIHEEDFDSLLLLIDFQYPIQDLDRDQTTTLRDWVRSGRPIGPTMLNLFFFFSSELHDFCYRCKSFWNWHCEKPTISKRKGKKKVLKCSKWVKMSNNHVFVIFTGQPNSSQSWLAHRSQVHQATLTFTGPHFP